MNLFIHSFKRYLLRANCVARRCPVGWREQFKFPALVQKSSAHKCECVCVFTDLSDFNPGITVNRRGPGNGRRQWQPTPVFLPGEPQGSESLVGCCLWGCMDTTEAT